MMLIKILSHLGQSQSGSHGALGGSPLTDGWLRISRSASTVLAGRRIIVGKGKLGSPHYISVRH